MRFAQVCTGKRAPRVSVHIAPPVMPGFSAGPNLSDLTRSKHGTPWHAFRHVPTPVAVEGPHFNQGSGKSDGRMLPPQIGCSIVSWETARCQAAGGAGADGFEYSPFCS